MTSRAERDHVKAVADELNRGIAAQAGFVLEVVRWETHARPDMGRAEQLILDQIGQYDLFVGIMWRRFGTPTGVAGSGTEEEFDHALRAWRQSGHPRLLCYFSRAPSEPPETVDEATQLLKVTQFRSQVEDQGLAWRYRSDADFKDLLREHLQQILLREFAGRRPPLDRNLLALPDADRPPSPEVAVPRQLPAAVAGFAGRAAELEALTSLLEEAALPGGTVVISAIDGTAGIGKTALAVQWAHQVADRFPDGQLYVNLRGFDPAGPPMDAGRGGPRIPGRLRSTGRTDPGQPGRPGGPCTAACSPGGGCWCCSTTPTMPTRSGRCCPARRAAAWW